VQFDLRGIYAFRVLSIGTSKAAARPNAHSGGACNQMYLGRQRD
jgi:hypothetical protein